MGLAHRSPNPVAQVKTTLRYLTLQNPQWELGRSYPVLDIAWESAPLSASAGVPGGTAFRVLCTLAPSSAGEPGLR